MTRKIVAADRPRVISAYLAVRVRRMFFESKVEIDDDRFVEGLAVEPGAPVLHVEAARAEPVGSSGVDLVFDGLYALHQFIGVGAGGDADASLHNAWPAVEFLGNEVHGAAVVGIAGLEYAFMRVEAGVIR